MGVISSHGFNFSWLPPFSNIKKQKAGKCDQSTQNFLSDGDKGVRRGEGTQNFCDGGVQALMGASPYWTALSVILGAMAVLPPSLPQRAKFRVLDDWLQNTEVLQKSKRIKPRPTELDKRISWCKRVLSLSAMHV